MVALIINPNSPSNLAMPMVIETVLPIGISAIVFLFTFFNGQLFHIDAVVIATFLSFVSLLISNKILDKQS